MSHLFVYEYTNQIFHALQSCLFFPYCLPLNLNLRLSTLAPLIRARGSSMLGIKTEVVLLPGVLAHLALVRSTLFCRSRLPHPSTLKHVSAL
jgi:hypothetical protein